MLLISHELAMAIPQDTQTRYPAVLSIRRMAELSMIQLQARLCSQAQSPASLVLCRFSTCVPHHMARRYSSFHHY